VVLAHHTALRKRNRKHQSHGIFKPKHPAALWPSKINVIFLHDFQRASSHVQYGDSGLPLEEHL
jgi:hypothetical protein